MVNARNNQTSASERCRHPSLPKKADIRLPVIAESQSAHSHGEIRKSKNGKRRAIVLAIVQLIMFAHIGLWLLSKKYGWFGGATISPIEPSESMEFSKNGVVNAGLIFFSLALLSTLILGRWFCGWGCHIVMLQDLCGWMMKKCGVRPRLFRSRFLMYVPLGLALYMFIMPAVHRWAMIPIYDRISQGWGDEHTVVTSVRNASWWLGFPLTSSLSSWEVQSHLTTTDFWKTFPGTYTAWFVVPVFLFICGFAIVYFLGAKGFCTYGCPYGGFFAPLDKLAPGRILVTDACEGCGHCTAVCTSNVRVHEEVREYGMVVDPGCMKCLDCVSVCPNEALYFGFAKPAVLKGKAKHKEPKRAYDLRLGEEFAFSAIFLFAFVALRGAYGLVPMLMAGGAAGVITFLAWKSWRLWRDPNVTLHRYQLKLKGVIKPAGWMMSAVAAIVLAFTAHTAVVNASINSARFHQEKVRVSQDAIFSPNPPALNEAMTYHADIAIKRLQVASSMFDGGIGLFRLRDWQAEIDMSMARLMCAKLNFEDAEQILRRAVRRDGVTDRFASSLTWVMAAQQRADEARAHARQIALENPNFPETVGAYVQLCSRANDSQAAESLLRAVITRDGPSDEHCARLMWTVAHQGRPVEAVEFGRPIVLDHADFNATFDALVSITGMMNQSQMTLDLCRARLERFPNHLHTMRVLSIILRQMGSYDESLALTKKTIEIDPKQPSAHFYMAMTLVDQGRLNEAESAMREALRLAPDNIQYNGTMGDLLNALERRDEAATFIEKAQQLQKAHQQSP
jgi:polyferredoxin/tetratricopeptide (TPR) repeat protein